MPTERSTRFAPYSTEIAPKSRRNRRTLTGLGLIPSDFGRLWPGLAGLARIQPNSSRVLPVLGRFRPNLSRVRPRSWSCNSPQIRVILARGGVVGGTRALSPTTRVAQVERCAWPNPGRVSEHGPEQQHKKYASGASPGPFVDNMRSFVRIARATHTNMELDFLSWGGHKKGLTSPTSDISRSTNGGPVQKSCTHV